MTTPIQFIETDPQIISAENTARLQDEVGRFLFPGDPLRNIGLAISYIQAILSAKANDSANQSFLEYAHGESLDALGVLVGVARRDSEAALTTLRFTLASARGDVTLIPLGSRATVQNSGIYFSTIETAEIPVGDTYVDVIAEASVLGPSANGFLIGEINTLVDSVMFIESVANTSVSSDGSEPEGDASLRERIREAPTRFSVAGPEDAYITLTKDSRADIESVTVESPSPRLLDIYFTLTNGVIPAPETITEVSNYINDKYRRPMSDVVTVDAPTEVEYTIDIEYFIAKKNESRSAEIQTAVTNAVASYVLWQRAQIGRDVNPSELISRIISAGALRVDVTTPVYAELEISELAVLDGTATIDFGGVVDE